MTISRHGHIKLDPEFVDGLKILYAAVMEKADGAHADNGYNYCHFGGFVHGLEFPLHIFHLPVHEGRQ